MKQREVNEERVTNIITKMRDLIDREAYKAYDKFPYHSQYDIDDFRQEARLAIVDAYCYSNLDEESEEFIPFAIRSIQRRLINYMWMAWRKRLYLYDEPTSINNVTDTWERVIPTFDDLHIIAPLSKEAKELLTTIFNPSDDLKATLFAKWTSGKPHCKNIFSIVVNFLGFGSKIETIKAEIREKVQYSF